MAASVSPAASPPRRHRHRHDDSPPRRRRRHDDDSPRHRRDDRKRRASPSPSPSPSPSDRDADRHRGKSRASPPRRPRDSDPAESNGGGAPKPGGDNGGDHSPRRARVPDADAEEGGRRRRRRSTDSDVERGDRDRHRRRHRRRSPSSESSDGGRSRRHRRDESSRRQRDERRRDRGGREERRRSPDRKEPTPPLPPPPPLLPEMIPGRIGGIYIPPFRMAQMMREVEDKSSPEYQRLSWDALKKSINGLVNKVNATNIKNIVPELFAENLVRGRGLFCQSCIKSQMASPGFTDVFAALVAVVNTKFPEIGRLLLVRVVLQLKRAYKRNDKVVAHELVALELLTVLLENPTDDSVELFSKDFEGFPAIRPELDLVEQEDQFTHEISLEDELDPETNLNVFRANPNFAEDEKAYENLKRSILGAESSDDEEGSDDASDEDAEEESDDEEDEEQMEIRDQTETNLINLRRTIYLTIMSSVDFEEAGHKLLKIKLEPGQEELSEHLGIRLLNEKLNDPNMQDSFDSIFPKDHPKNTRFSINFFTSIGLGGITETLREYLKNMPRLIMQQQKPASSESGSSDSGSASDSSSSELESSSDESEKKRSKRRKR
uniref:MI domain-containing protein n=1 Tax=Oryza meridionalis TaxID=40149 RepID=A0A0E0FAX9_9ORYZ